MSDFLIGFALGICISLAMDELGVPRSDLLRILDL